AYEHGSRRRTILLGALAGRRFFLTAVTEVREGDHAAEIHYRWGPAAGLALGGTIGRSRAERVHTQLAAELEAQLERSGHLLQVSSRRGARPRAARPAGVPSRTPGTRARNRHPGSAPGAGARHQSPGQASGIQGGHHARQILGEVVAPQVPVVGGAVGDVEVVVDAGLAERPGEALQVRMDRVLDDVGPDLLELGLQRRPDVGMVLEPVEEVEPGPVPGAQEHPLVPVGAYVVDRVV